MKRNESASYLRRHARPAPPVVWLLTLGVLVALGGGGFVYMLLFGRPDIP